jgi:hypothetical protein
MASERGFTRTELAVLIATGGLLALLQAASVGALNQTTQATQCLQNLRDLTVAWQQYGLDNGHLPPNPDDGNTTPGYHWAPGQAGRGGAQEFNPDPLADPARSLLYSYLTPRDVSVFRCPADVRIGRYGGSKPEFIGTTVPAARSYAMNGAVGINPYAPTVRPANGPWLDNNHAHTYGSKWRTYGSFDDMIDPAPTHLAVLLGEDSDSINDGYFAFGMEREEWIDWVSTRHGMSGGIAFADGRAEMHPWEDPRTMVVNHPVARRLVTGSVDYQWLRRRISAPIRLERAILVQPAPSIGQNGIRLAWPVTDGPAYQVESTLDLKHWRRLDADVKTAAGQLVTEVPDAMTDRERFYRLVPR